MIFTQSQIDELIDIIDFSHIFFIAGNISPEILSSNDKSILSKFGVDWTHIREGFTPYEQLYYFGRLAAVLGPLNAQQVSFTDLKQYLRRGQFIPLSSTEKGALDYLETRSYNYIKNLGQQIKTSILSSVQEENIARERYYNEVINDSVKRAIVERDSVKSIISEIGHKTGQWERDLGRIAETELQNAYEYGKGSTYNEVYGDERVYYKEVYPGACQHCIRLYLSKGVGSEPILFTYQELLENGTNIGRKVQDWRATLGTVHPFCRCDLRVRRSKRDVWDADQGIFIPSKQEKQKGEIKIEVGDKIFRV